MANELDPKSDADRLRDSLLGQWEPDRSSYLNYRKEVEAMLAKQEKSLLRERNFAAVMWIYAAVLSTSYVVGSGLFMIHKVEGTWMAVSGVLWFLFGAVYLLMHHINNNRFEVIKEIKGVELRLAALEERLTGRSDGA